MYRLQSNKKDWTGLDWTAIYDLQKRFLERGSTKLLGVAR